MAPNPRSRQPHLAVPRSRSSLLGITLEGLAPNPRSRFASLAEPRSHRCQQRSTTEGAPSSLPLTYASSRGLTLKDPVLLRTGPHVRGPSPDDRGWSAGLHGHLCGGRGDQVAKAPGTGPGWQQSRQNWMPAAVVGQRIRMESRGLCNVEAAPLHSVLCFFCPVLVPALLLHPRGSLVAISVAWHCDVFMT